MAVDESIKLLPWIMNARKHLRAYVKVRPPAVFVIVSLTL